MLLIKLCRVTAQLVAARCTASASGESLVLSFPFLSLCFLCLFMFTHAASIPPMHHASHSSEWLVRPRHTHTLSTSSLRSYEQTVMTMAPFPLDHDEVIHTLGRAHTCLDAEERAPTYTPIASLINHNLQIPNQRLIHIPRSPKQAIPKHSFTPQPHISSFKSSATGTRNPSPKTTINNNNNNNNNSYASLSQIPFTYCIPLLQDLRLPAFHTFTLYNALHIPLLLLHSHIKKRG